jgi:hypothetical protein
MASLIKIIALGLSLICLTAGCSPPPKAPCPTDQTLLENFKRREADFARLSTHTDDEELRSSLGLGWIRKKPGEILFSAWYKDFAGPGGCMKGYAYRSQPPHSLVDSIDDHTKPRPCGPEEKALYRHMQGNWYIIYVSSH